jgi:hypothetical protein
MRASFSSTQEPMKPESRLSSEQGLDSAVNLAGLAGDHYDNGIRAWLVKWSAAFRLNAPHQWFVAAV